jgi:pimeloyl-CoA synthetase
MEVCQRSAAPPRIRRERVLDALARGHEVRGREDHRGALVLDDLTGERVDYHDPLDLIAPHLDTHDLVLVHRRDLDDIAAHAERAARGS